MCWDRITDSQLAMCPNNTLWNNPCLQESHTLADVGQYKTFKELKTEFNSYFFAYLQLRHAAVAQFGVQGVILQTSQMQGLFGQNDYVKFISR